MKIHRMRIISETVVWSIILCAIGLIGATIIVAPENNPPYEITPVHVPPADIAIVPLTKKEIVECEPVREVREVKRKVYPDSLTECFSWRRQVIFD